MGSQWNSLINSLCCWQIRYSASAKSDKLDIQLNQLYCEEAHDVGSIHPRMDALPPWPALSGVYCTKTGMVYDRGWQCHWQSHLSLWLFTVSYIMCCFEWVLNWDKMTFIVSAYSINPFMGFFLSFLLLIFLIPSSKQVRYLPLSMNLYIFLP